MSKRRVTGENHGNAHGTRRPVTSPEERNETMTQTNHSWRVATYIIPKGAELVCDNAVRTDRFIFGAALIRYEGKYWLCQNYCLYAVDQGAAEAFAATL